MKPLGVILAGGLSRRMEGAEKTLLHLGGKSLIARVFERFECQVDEIVINANGDAARFADIDAPVQSDTVEGFVGPLAGVLAGMRWAKANTNATHVITVAADTPFFPKDYCTQMLSSLALNSSQIALAASDGRKHPVFGLWPIALADALESFLVVEENRKVMLFVERYANCQVDFTGVKSDPFFNVNTPEDFARAETLVEAAASKGATT